MQIDADVPFIYFSSRTLSLSDWRGTGSLKTVILALCLIAMAEGVARMAIAPIGDYWRYWTPAAAAKFETYRGAVRDGSGARLVVVGDSPGARDIDPARLGAAGFGDERVQPVVAREFSARLQGVHAAGLFRDGTAPDLVVASFSPTGFLESPRVSR